MTTFTGPLIVTSAAGDGSETFKVSGNGQVSTDAGLAITGDTAIIGTATIAGHTIAASALTLVLGTNAEASAGNGGAVPTTAAGFFELTVDGTAAVVPYFKVPT